MFGLKKSNYDHSIFYKQSAAGIILHVVYVNDIVITVDDYAEEYLLSSHSYKPSFIQKT